MKNPLNFSEPKTAFQWIIFLAAIGITLSSPVGTRNFLKELHKHLNGNRNNKNIDKVKISQAIYSLKKRKLISLEEKGSQIKITLTDKGKKKKLEYNMTFIQSPKQINWDEKWRFVMFDIPHSLKAKRDYFRFKLKNMGFMQFQKSIWVYPYPCEDEIDFITEYLNIGKYINLLTVQVEDDIPLKTYFKFK